VDVGHADVEDGFLPRLSDLDLDLALGTLVHLLDPRGMDAAVGHELLEREPADLAANRIEARKQHRFGGVVDDDVDPGRGLERADVAALATDDPALHVVGRQRDRGDRRFGRLLGGESLDRESDDATGAPFGFLASLGLELSDGGHSLPLGLVFDALHERRFGLRGRHAGDPLELLADVLDAAVDLAAGL
jgi:hypothetical protein